MSLFSKSEFNEISKTLNTVKEKCLICRDELSSDIIILTCGHKYHFECLKDTFTKYYKKTCPYCDDHIILSEYQSKCCAILSNGTECGKLCYNSEKLCKRHTNIYVKKKEKEKKMVLDKVNKLKSKVNDYTQKIHELNDEINKLEATI